MNKSLIITRIKSAYNFKTNAELAQFLEVSPATITNWASRNTIDFELIFTKCKDIDYDWLLTGNGEMFRNPAITDKENEILMLKIEMLEKRIQDLEKIINDKEHIIEILSKTEKRVGGGKNT